MNNTSKQHHTEQASAITANVSKNNAARQSMPAVPVIQRAVGTTNVLNESDPVLGTMNRSFKWLASDPHSNGYIIQKIVRTETITTGDATVVQNYNYWEAWKVTDNAIFNGGQAIGGIQHDSWYQKDMPPGTHGSIQMTATVYFSTVAELAGMAHGAVEYAGNLLASNGEPAEEKQHMLDHSYTFNWDRRLVGGNIDAIVKREMVETVNLEGEEGQTFADISEDWDGEQWGEFAGSVNAHDPGHEQTLENIKRIALA